MSETVYFKGMLKAMEKMEGETIEAQCKRLLGVEELPSHFESYEEYLMDEHYQEYVIRNEVLYQVEKQEVDPDSDTFRANVNEDGNIEFEVRYYNGGCSLDDAIQQALKSIEPIEPKEQKEYKYFISYVQEGRGFARCEIVQDTPITGISDIEAIEKLFFGKYNGLKISLLNYQLMEVNDVKQESVETSDTCIICEAPLGKSVAMEKAICYNCYHGVEIG